MDTPYQAQLDFTVTAISPVGNEPFSDVELTQAVPEGQAAALLSLRLPYEVAETLTVGASKQVVELVFPVPQYPYTKASI
jgi:hypothetical protein